MYNDLQSIDQLDIDSVHSKTKQNEKPIKSTFISGPSTLDRPFFKSFAAFHPRSLIVHIGLGYFLQE